VRGVRVARQNDIAISERLEQSSSIHAALIAKAIEPSDTDLIDDLVDRLDRGF
jgi:hypothetical protein